MADKRNIHTVRDGDRWVNRPEGGGQVGGSFDTQGRAAEAGRQEAEQRGGEHFIHRPNGQIRERNTYREDPFPPKG